jgi:methylase of polypeptide subunit release factors/MoxR-like ATPase/GAF domain-containing protein
MIGSEHSQIAEYDKFKAELELSLRRWGRYLISADEYPLLLSAILAHSSEFAWVCVWRREAPHRYRLKFSTLDRTQLTDTAQQKMNATIAGAFDRRVIRAGNALHSQDEVGSFPAVPLPQEIQVSSSVPSASSVCLVFSTDQQILLEIYSNGVDVDPLHVRTIIDGFYEARSNAIMEYELADPAPERALYQERQLFDVILHEIKGWLGKDFGMVNLFLYDGRERMLYHRATTSLRIQPQSISSYVAVPQASDGSLLDHIRANIDLLEGVDQETKEHLVSILGNLANTQTIRENALSWEHDLRLLLTVLPQEPGTGVAGHTALTLVPEIYNSSVEGESKWLASTYPTERFALMLSVEQMFGIGNSGSMAAVPLIESGQLAGVLFVVRDEPFSYRRDLAVIMEKAAQISTTLTTHRLREFQYAIMAAAAAEIGSSITQLAAANAPLAFNTLLTVAWHMAGGKIETISIWGFKSPYSTYGLISNHDPNREMWRSEVELKHQVHAWSKNRELVWLNREGASSAGWGLPMAYAEKYEQLTHANLNSGVVVFPPTTDDVMVMYFGESASVTRSNLGAIAKKLFPLYPVERLRSRPKQDLQEIVGESPQIKKALKDLLGIKTKKRIMLQGPSGAGKSLFAEHIHRICERQGELIRINAKDSPDTLIQDELFGHVKGGYTDAKADKPGIFELVHGGTLFIDDFDTASLDAQNTLLRVVETGRVKRLGATKDKKVDFLLVTATNKTGDELKDIVRQDLIFRFAEGFVQLPSLEERRMDIPLLLRSIFTRVGKPEKRLDPSAWLKLLNAEWPGSVRVLEYIAHDLAALKHDTIGPELIEPRPGFIPANGNGPIELMDVSNHIGIEELGIESKVEILLDCHTYRPNQNPKYDWGSLAARAFRVLKTQGSAVETYFSMGCGAGLDAIAASLILECERVVLADVHPEVVAFARENLLLNRPTLTLDQVFRYESDLFSDIPKDVQQADLIFENLPNIVPNDLLGNVLGNDRKSATYLHRRRTEDVPQEFRDALLELHYIFLQEAKAWLSENGSVLCSIGARVGWETVEHMFVQCGYTPELLVFDFKEQEQAAEVISGYALAEERSPSQNFRFYLAEDASTLLNSLSLRNGASGFALNRVAVEKALERIQLTATDAKEFSEADVPVGHMVYLVKGTPT